MKLLLCFYICVRAALALQKLDTVYEWKYIDYLWESEEQKADYVRDFNFDVKDVFPVDVDISSDGRVFVTALGKHDKIPSLSVVTNEIGPGGALLQPYPDWSWYNKNDCDGISAIYRVIADECNRLYVLDTGYHGHNASCPAQVLIFDLHTDTLITKFQIPNHIARDEKGAGMLVTPVIETSGPDCKPIALYMADVYGGGVVTMTTDHLIRLSMQIFKPEKKDAIIEIVDEKVELEASLIGMALSPEVEGEKRQLFVRPFASRSLYSIDSQDITTSYLNNKIRYKAGIDMLPSQAVTMAAASDGTVFFGLVKETAIGCWNHYRPMNADNLDIIDQDDVKLQFVSGLKVFPSTRTQSNLEELWVVTNRFHKITLNKLNHNDINFRILKGSVKDLTQNTKCEKPVNSN